MEMEQARAVDCADSFIDVEKCDVLQGLCQSDAAFPLAGKDDARIFELPHDCPDNDRIGSDAASQKGTRHLYLVLEIVNTGDDMDGNGKTAGYLHDEWPEVAGFARAFPSLPFVVLFARLCTDN